MIIADRLRDRPVERRALAQDFEQLSLKSSSLCWCSDSFSNCINSPAGSSREWRSTRHLSFDFDSLRAAFEPLAAELGADWTIRREEDRMRVVLLVRMEDCASCLSLQRNVLSIVCCRFLPH